MTAQLPMDFDGATYTPARDQMRLTAQALRVWTLMLDGRWRTLHDIAELTNDPEASVSARLRDFRKARFGSHTIERRYVRRGLYEYRLVPNPEPQPNQETN